MTRGKLLLGAVPAVLALSITPAMAQRSASGGEVTGSAVSRGGGDGGGGGGGGAVSRGGGESSAGSSSSSSGSSGSGGYSTPSAGGSSSTREYVTAPSRPSERQRRGGGDGESTGRAMPRGGGSSAGSSGSSTRATAPSSGSRTSNPADRAVPEYSRPRGDRPAQGNAVERRPGNIPGEVVIPRYYYNPYLNGRYFWPGYAFGLGYGYGYYDPWYDPYGFGGYGGYGYDPYGGVASGRGSYERVGTGSVRLKIKPRDAEVYVDGYFVGTVDEFDGMFQKLTIDAGPHKIEIRAEGHEVTAFDVLITPGETVTYKGDLKRIQ